jgi:hypothetical protein
MSALAKVLKREITDVRWPESVRATVDIDPYNLL